MEIRPPSAATAPETHFINVDFPAPLAPRTAWTVPLRTVRSTPFSTGVPPNDLERLSTRSGTLSDIVVRELRYPLLAPLIDVRLRLFALPAPDHFVGDDDIFRLIVWDQILGECRNGLTDSLEVQRARRSVHRPL